MGKKFFLLEIIARPRKSPIVYIWTHHGKGLEGEWRGEMIQPRLPLIRRWLQNLFVTYYKHHRAYVRARMRGEKAVKHYGPRESIRRMALLAKEEKDGNTDDA